LKAVAEPLLTLMKDKREKSAVKRTCSSVAKKRGDASDYILLSPLSFNLSLTALIGSPALVVLIKIAGA